MSVPSFSLSVKEEILSILDEEKVHRDIGLAVALAASASFTGRTIQVKSKHLHFLEYVQAMAQKYFHVEGKIIEKKNFSTWELHDSQDVLHLKAVLDELLAYDSLRGVIHRESSEFLEEEITQILRTVFLAVGSMADPNKSYQIEFAMRRQSVMEFLRKILQTLEIEGFLQVGFQSYMLYIKNGDQVSNFLGRLGVDQSYLQFESIRVRKNMNEMVNRTINFDNANIERIANTSARQINVIAKLAEHQALEQMPEELYEIAMLRVENPGFSLRELGSLLDPPLGKSGVYHRLGKLEQWAQEYMEEKE